ncbi:MAG: hypothetical protein J1E80_06770 [Desulfovibrionaceae bacterium]|nr:hypothetical protein [Desulfovibrionaceae bacterium]
MRFYALCCSKKNAIIFYPTHGVCEISGISHKRIGADTTECHHVHPLYEKNCSFLIPASNTKATGKMRRVLSRRERKNRLPGE